MFFGNGFAPDRGEMNVPLEASDTLVPKYTPNDQLRYSALRQLILWQKEGLQESQRITRNTKQEFSKSVT